MKRMIRLTINLLLITLVINGGGWTFNKEAVADVWFDEQHEQHSLAVNDDHFSGVSEDLKTASPKIPCNHWCHSIGHFVGFHSEISHVTPEFTSEYSNQQVLCIQLSSIDSLYRPPRLLS
jgi:hypothetical protein